MIKNRDISVVDIPNAFVQAALIKNGKAVKRIIVIRERFTDINISIVPDVYKKFATTNKHSITVLYVKLLRVLYGLIEASLVFYQKLLKEKEAKGRPCDPCVVDKEINGSQFTNELHLDDLDLSHKDPKVLDEIIQHLIDLYKELPNGEIKRITVKRTKS